MSMSWQADDAATELLLAHASLDDVLRFVIAREDVRAIAAESTVDAAPAITSSTVRPPGVATTSTIRVREVETMPAPRPRRVA
jgi:hypothetical protein